MAVNVIWRVIYDFRDGNKKSSWDGQQVAYVIAADNKEDTLRTVLVNNGIVRPGGTINIISSVQSAGQGSNVLS